MGVTYDDIINFLRATKTRNWSYAIKPLYTVISLPQSAHHITIFKDQWDEYGDLTGRNYHMFHISLNKEQDRCSSYFWVHKQNLKIRFIPEKYFKYNQPDYGMHSSTRSACDIVTIGKQLRFFQWFVKQIGLGKINT